MKTIHLCSIYLFFISSVFAQSDGIIDLTFGNQGVFLSNFASGASGETSIAVDMQNNILIAGGVANYYFAAIKCNQLGKVDSTFGTDGYFRFHFGLGIDNCKKVLIQEDNKIILGGYSYKSGLVDSSQISIIRLHSSGIIDSTFGEYGTFKYNLFPILCGAYTLTLQNDGKIIAAGRYVNFGPTQVFVCRLKQNGTLDSSFANNGFFISSINQLNGSDVVTSCVFQSDQKILIGYNTVSENQNNRVFGVLRLTSEGLLDSSFGVNGNYKIDIPFYQNDYLNTLKLHNDGRILLAGSTNYGNIMALCQLLPNGLIDTTFGNDGINLIDLSPDIDILNDIVIQADSKILACGKSNNNACIIRTTANGNLDSTFNQTGTIIIDNSMGEYFTDLELLNPTKMLVGGILKDSNQYFQLAVAAYDFSLFSGVSSIYQNSQIDVFPNPTHDVINLTTEILDSENITVDIFDLSGRNIQQINKGQLAKGKNYISIDSKEWQAGVYLIKVSLDGRTIGNKKIIKR